MLIFSRLQELPLVVTSPGVTINGTFLVASGRQLFPIFAGSAFVDSTNCGPKKKKNSNNQDKITSVTNTYSCFCDVIF
jgi:hypothetical protein